MENDASPSSPTPSSLPSLPEDTPSSPTSVTGAIVSSSQSITTDASSIKKASRDVLRERERRSRQRRQRKLVSMEHQVHTLEQAALVVRVLPDADAIWDEFLDPDIRAIRTNFRLVFQLAKEAQRLQNEHQVLLGLLTERELWRRTVERLLEAEMGPGLTWVAKVARWLALTYRYYEPLTMAEYEDIRARAIHEMEQFSWNTKKQSTGLNFLGWHEERQFVPATKALNFSFFKTYDGINPDQYHALVWRSFSQEEMYFNYVLNGRGHCMLQVIQELLPTAWIVRTVENYPHHPNFDVHNLYVIFEATLDDGTQAQFLRTIVQPAMQRVVNTESDIWATSSYWFSSERTNQVDGFRISMGGHLYAEDPAFANLWLLETLGVVLRYEAKVGNQSLLGVGVTN